MQYRSNRRASSRIIYKASYRGVRSEGDWARIKRCPGTNKQHENYNEYVLTERALRRFVKKGALTDVEATKLRDTIARPGYRACLTHSLQYLERFHPGVSERFWRTRNPLPGVKGCPLRITR